MKATRAPIPSSSTSAARNCPTSSVRRAIAHAINVPFFIENFLGDFAKLGTGPIPSTSTDFYPGAEHAAISLRQGQGRRAAGRGRLQGAAAAARASRCSCCPRPGARTSRCGRPSSSSRCGEIGIPVEIVRNDGGGFLKQVYDEHELRSRHRLAPVPQRSRGLDHGLVPLRPAQGRALDQPVGLGGHETSTRPSTTPRPRSIRPSARRSTPSSSRR